MREAYERLGLARVGRPAGALMLPPEVARKNVRWGLALFGLFLVLFAGTVAVALLYLAAD